MPKVRLPLRALPLLAGVLLLLPSPVAAQDKLCDPGFEDCRQILINHIRAERVGLDVAFWFMEDTWIASEVINLHTTFNVPVRVIMDSRANATNSRNAQRLQELAAAGIPMRERFASGIMHWKMMLFAGQGIVQFSGANYSSSAWVYYSPGTNYIDEAIYFTSKSSVVDSFKTKFDDLWTNTTAYRNYANVNTPPVRTYGVFPIDPELNFPPNESYAVRAVNEYYRETQKMDVIMYRITDRRHTDALIAMKARGLPIRLITDPQQYRDPTRLWHSWNVDRLYMAGIPIKVRTHQGLNHQKSVLLYGLGMTIFGSSNWTSPSAQSQEEHNYFTRDPFVFQWFVDQFERKWNNSAGVDENGPFTPLPPGAPSQPQPAQQATQVPTTGVTLKWDGSPWAHKYDIYLGTSPANMQPLAQNLELGPSQSSGDLRTFAIGQTLQPGTIYYWQIVGRTMADMTAASPVWSFTTTGSAPPPPTLPAPWASNDIGVVGISGSAEYSAGTFTVRGSGADVWGTADGLHLAWQQVTDDFDLVARIASIENVNVWTKAGVMIRASLSPGSPQAFMLGSPGKGLAFQRRIAAGGTSTSTSGGAGTAPVWVKLERRGSVITAYRSSDGSAWTLVGSDTFAIGATVYAGLAMSSHDNTRLAAATFDNVAINPSGTTPPPPNAAPSVSITAPSSGATFTEPATITLTASASDTDGTVTKVEFFAGTTLVGSATASPFTAQWSSVPAGSYQITAVATDDDGATTTSGAVSVTVTAAPSGGLPAPWTSQDIGAVGVVGQASESSGTFSVRGGGADVWGTADGLHFAWQPFTGDVDVIARVASVENVHQWTKAGVMIRGGLSPSSAQAFMLVSPSKGRAFQRRPQDGGNSVSTSGGAGTAPVWVKLERRGNVVSAYLSTNGTSWTLVGTDTIALPADAYVGLAVSSHDTTRAATATFDSVSVSVPGPSQPPPPPLPLGWTSAEIGSTGVAGSALESSGTFTVRGSGADIWGTADALHYASQQITGDFDVVARVATVEYVHAWTKAGVMIRGALTADAAQAMMLASPGKGWAFQRRLDAAGLSFNTAGPAGTAPGWVKLERRGNSVSAFHSTDGVAWTLVGTDVLTLPSQVYVGLGVSSHVNTRLATATFDSVTITAR